MNKKFLILTILAILSGLILGNAFYKQYEKEQHLDNKYNSYLLQLGVYDSKEKMQKHITNIENYTVIENNKKYYVYVGMSTKKDNAKKVANVFHEQNIDVTIKKSVINNIEFISNLEQFDILLDTATSNEDIMSINDVILSSYEEIVLED